MLVLRNDAASAVCRLRLHLPRPYVADLNRVLARQIAGIFMPVEPSLGRISAGASLSSGTDGFWRGQNYGFQFFRDGISHLCSHPVRKLFICN